jgi:hypothetical protein
MKRSLGENLFFAIFGTFGIYVTNLRGTFVENVKKKSKINPPYSTVCIWPEKIGWHHALQIRWRNIYLISNILKYSR